MATVAKAPRRTRGHKGIKMALHATHRDAGKVTVVDLSGRITLGDGSALLRKTVRGLLDDQRMQILSILRTWTTSTAPESGSSSAASPQ